MAWYKRWRQTEVYAYVTAITLLCHGFYFVCLYEVLLVMAKHSQWRCTWPCFILKVFIKYTSLVTLQGISLCQSWNYTEKGRFVYINKVGSVMDDLIGRYRFVMNRRYWYKKNNMVANVDGAMNDQRAWKLSNDG